MPKYSRTAAKAAQEQAAQALITPPAAPVSQPVDQPIKTIADPDQPRLIRQPHARRAMTMYGEEARTKRVQIVLTPTMYKQAAAKAEEYRVSFNELVTIALEQLTGSQNDD